MTESEKRELVSAHVRKIAPLYAVPLTYLQDIVLRLLANDNSKIFVGDEFQGHYVDLELCSLMDAADAAHLFPKNELADTSTPAKAELSDAEKERERLKTWLASEEGQKASPIERMKAADRLSMTEQRAEKSAKDLSFERYLANKVKGYRDWGTWSPERRNLASIEARAEFDAVRKGTA